MQQLSRQLLLAVTSLLEIATGLTLLISSSSAAAMLLGSPLDTGGIIVGRVAGAALLAIGVACGLTCLTRSSDSGPRASIAALLVYNLTVVAVLVSATFEPVPSTRGLWIASGLHSVLALWCIACLQSMRSSNIKP